MMQNVHTVPFPFSHRSIIQNGLILFSLSFYYVVNNVLLHLMEPSFIKMIQCFGLGVECQAQASKSRQGDFTPPLANFHHYLAFLFIVVFCLHNCCYWCVCTITTLSFLIRSMNWMMKMLSRLSKRFKNRSGRRTGCYVY